LSFDHADIFDDIDSIIKNFHHLIRIIPNNGTIIFNQDDKNINKLIKKGVWSKQKSLTTKKNNTKSDWLLKKDNQKYLLLKDNKKALIQTSLIGTS
jgi:UDP-N-acetylmuramate: L-alanyl-gamma-D-glutamyl-meso-diaminopimelate ligase